MLLIYLALATRIFLIGTERVFIKKLKHYDGVAIAFWWFFITLCLYLPFAIYYGFGDLFYLPYAFIAGPFYALAFFLYIKAIQMEDISLVGPLYNFNAIFILIIAAIFLGEAFTLFKVAGILLLLFGASFLSRGKDLFNSYKNLFTNRAALYMLGCSFLVSFGRIVDGYVVKDVQPVVYAMFTEIAIVLTILAYMAFSKKLHAITGIIRDRPFFTFTFGFSNALSYLALLTTFTALEVSVADPLTMLSAIVTIIWGKFLFKEKVGARIVGAVIMFGGAWLLVA